MSTSACMAQGMFARAWLCNSRVARCRGAKTRAAIRISRRGRRERQDGTYANRPAASMQQEIVARSVGGILLVWRAAVEELEAQVERATERPRRHGRMR